MPVDLLHVECPPNLVIVHLASIYVIVVVCFPLQRIFSFKPSCVPFWLLNLYLRVGCRYPSCAFEAGFCAGVPMPVPSRGSRAVQDLFKRHGQHRREPEVPAGSSGRVAFDEGHRQEGAFPCYRKNLATAGCVYLELITTFLVSLFVGGHWTGERGELGADPNERCRRGLVPCHGVRAAGRQLAGRPRGRDGARGKGDVFLFFLLSASSLSLAIVLSRFCFLDSRQFFDFATWSDNFKP